MSTIQAVNIKSASSASNNIVLDASGNATFAGTAAMASSFLRNRIINGDMRIDQRNAGASVAVSSLVYTLDRWAAFGGGGTMTVQRVAGSASGFQNAIQITGGAGVTQAQLYQRVEANNCWDLAGGTVTLSFTASSSSLTSLTAYFGSPTSGAADNWGSGATLISQSSVTLSSTPTRFSVTVSLSAGAANGLQIMFYTPAFTSGTLTITGVQLEVGTVATPFERRQFGQELALCQRYYNRDVLVAVGGGATPLVTNRSFFCSVNWPVAMRAAPTMALITTLANTNMNAGAWVNLTSSRGRFSATNSVANDCALEAQYSADIEL
jgi:hypothetical protein